MPTLLNPRFELIAQALANGKTQLDAYTAAGFSAKGARSSSTMLLKRHPEIKVRVSELLAMREQLQARSNLIASERLAVTLTNILRESARIAFSDPAKLFKEDGSLKHITEMDEDTRASIGLASPRSRLSRTSR